MLKYELEERLPTYQVDIDEKQSFRPCAETDVWRLLVGTAHALQ